LCFIIIAPILFLCDSSSFESVATSSSFSFNWVSSLLISALLKVEATSALGYAGTIDLFKAPPIYYFMGVFPATEGAILPAGTFLFASTSAVLLGIADDLVLDVSRFEPANLDADGARFEAGSTVG